MQMNKKKFFCIILVFLSVWLTGVQINHALQTREIFTSESVRLTEGNLKGETIETALENEKEIGTLSVSMVTAWSALNHKEIENTYLNRKERVTVIVVSGDMTATVPMNLVYGNYVYQEDKKGCVIDVNTAYSLFGTINAVENMVIYNKKQYCIRGIVESEVPVFLYQGMDKLDEYINLELCFSEMGNGEELAKQFMGIYQLSNDYVIIDSYFFGNIIYSVLVLPIWLLFLCFSIYAVITFVKRKSLLAGAMIVIMTGCGLLLYKAFGNPFYLPEKFIPTKWSDLSFWTRQWNALKDQIIRIRYLNPNPKDVLLMDLLSDLFYYFTRLIVLYTITIFYGKRHFL